MSEDYNFDPKDALNAKNAFLPTIGVKKEPKDDPIISKIVGHPVKINNPILIRLIVKWKKEEGKSDSDTSISGYLNDPNKLEELKKAL